MDYVVTRFVSKFGFYAGAALIAICGLIGFVTSGILGGLGSLVVGAILTVPFLMFCEGMHALVTIANNTKKDHVTDGLKKVS